MKKRVIGIVSMVFMAFVVGYLIGSFNLKLKVIETTEDTATKTLDSFDGEYIVKFGLKEFRLTEYDLPQNIGVVNVKKGVISYNVNVRGLIKSGKSTYKIKDGSVFFDGIDIGVIVEHSKIKGDFTIDLNRRFKKHYITLEKRL